MCPPTETGDIIYLHYLKKKTRLELFGTYKFYRNFTGVCSWNSFLSKEITLMGKHLIKTFIDHLRDWTAFGWRAEAKTPSIPRHAGQERPHVLPVGAQTGGPALLRGRLEWMECGPTCHAWVGQLGVWYMTMNLRENQQNLGSQAGVLLCIIEPLLFMPATDNNKVIMGSLWCFFTALQQLVIT